MSDSPRSTMAAAGPAVAAAGGDAPEPARAEAPSTPADAPRPARPMTTPPQSHAAAIAGAVALDPKLQRLLYIIAWMVIIAASAGALVLLMPAIQWVFQLLLPFLAGLTLAYILDPIVTFVQVRLRLSRVVGMIVLYLLILGGLAAFVALLLPALYEQLINGLNEIQSTVPKRVQEFLHSKGINFEEIQRTIKDYLAAHNISIDQLAQKATSSPEARDAAQTAARSGISILVTAFGAILSFVGSLFSSIGFLVLVVVINFYLLLDFSKLRDAYMPIFPSAVRPRANIILEKLDKAVGGFLRGQIIDCVLVGMLTTLGLMILGLKQYALIIGFIAGAANFIPYLGPLMGGIPAGLYILFSSSYAWPQEKLIYLGGVVALFAIVQAIDGFVFQPRIVGKAAQLHPLAVTLALVVGANVGIMGMIVAVPAACVVRVLLKELWWDARVAKYRAAISAAGARSSAATATPASNAAAKG